ncbi:hypothetical protein K438DRAFT_1809892 [Mycena galopus ATCC 62051]|nr:hypothetical protein K438DRAFT_1809892 [Mycena galopus ATCC 62051]
MSFPSVGPREKLPCPHWTSPLKSKKIDLFKPSQHSAFSTRTPSFNATTPFPLHHTPHSQMPVYRTKMRCAYADPLPVVKKPRAPKIQLTADEKEAAKIQRGVNQVLREKKKEWEATLKPWTGDERTRLPLNALALFKSDDRYLTLPHETIANSFKSYYALDCVKDLARRKFLAGAMLADLSKTPTCLKLRASVPGSRTAIRFAKMP